MKAFNAQKLSMLIKNACLLNFLFLIINCLYSLHVKTEIQLQNSAHKIKIYMLNDTSACSFLRAMWLYIYTVFQKNPCDYVFDDNLNSKRPIVIIFGTVIT